MKKIAIIGASLGGLVAASELKSRGFDVTIIEKGKSLGGLYGKVNTPFGIQELGMHVIYVDDDHYRHMQAIFGTTAFNERKGYQADIGGSYNFGRLFSNSIYPDVRTLPNFKAIHNQVIRRETENHEPKNALDAVKQRFGEIAATSVFSPILEKLWKEHPEKLSKDAIHCFYDLRRIVVADKAEANELKNDPWLDSVVANPDQRSPHGQVFSGRRALFFRAGADNLSAVAEKWLRTQRIEILFEQDVEINEQNLVIGNTPLHALFDACIVATPISTIAKNVKNALGYVELSVLYFKLKESIKDVVPLYYVLCHSNTHQSSRIVNYSAYNFDNNPDFDRVLSIEILHSPGVSPLENELARELLEVFPFAKIDSTYRFPRNLQVPQPSNANGNLLDKAIQHMEKKFAEDALFFAGMRTDRGIFFSHHTIGAAYAAALECTRRLS